MEYNYVVLKSVLKEIAKDDSIENIYDQVDRLTTDEIRKLQRLISSIDMAGTDKLIHMGELN